MKSVKQSWHKNEWVIALGSGIILLVIPSIWDVISGKEFTNTLRWLFNLNIKLGWVFIIIFITTFSIIFIRSKYKQIPIYEPLFPEGVQVIMKTNVKPIMITGEFNKRTNEVWCSWTINSEIRKEKINQNLIKLYEPVVTFPISGSGRKSSYW